MTEFIAKKAWDPAWERVVIFTVGLLEENAEPIRQLLRELSAAKTDDYFRHRLAVAAMCLPEIDPRIRESLSGDVDEIARQVIERWHQAHEFGTTGAVPHLSRSRPAMAACGGVFFSTVEQGLRDQRSRRWTLELVREVGAAARRPGVLEGLVACLRDPEGDVRSAAAWALGALGSAAAERPGVVEGLVACLRDPEGYVRRAAAEAIPRVIENTRVFRGRLGKPRLRAIADLAATTNLAPLADPRREA